MYSRTTFAVLLLAALALTAVAQAPAVGGMALGVAGGKGIVTMRADDADVEPAKGIPFCATLATEHTQTFADGNRIHTSNNSSVCRDSEGRTRREAGLNLLGAAAQTSAPKLITIVDPVAGFRYMLDSETKTAHKIPLGPPEKARGITGEAVGAPEKGARVMFYQHVGPGEPGMDAGGDVLFTKRTEPASDGPAPAKESLGDQTIEGMHATGTRITTTIPAGQMGNEQPILITSERWYSPELKATVMTKHSDPWAGELKTQLTNVNTAEPDASLFQVPADYKVLNDKPGPFIIQKRKLAPPPPPE